MMTPQSSIHPVIPPWTYLNCQLLVSYGMFFFQIKQWIEKWDLSTQKVQHLLRTVHGAFQETKMRSAFISETPHVSNISVKFLTLYNSLHLSSLVSSLFLALWWSFGDRLVTYYSQISRERKKKHNYTLLHGIWSLIVLDVAAT